MHVVHAPVPCILMIAVLTLNCMWFAHTDTYTASKEVSPDVNKYIRMANSSGHSFECTVPPASVHPVQTDQFGAGQVAETTAATVLESLSARCFYRLEDWWTYELCYQKHVRQFHRERDMLTAEYLLGVYQADSADTDSLQGEANGVDSGRYVKEIYNQGDACDLTGQVRQTEVRYVCSEGDQENIISIKETSTCHYVLTVAVPGLCQLPIFRAQAEPITQIICRPVAAPAAETSSTDHESQQQQHARFDDGDLVQDDSDHDSGTNSTDLDHHDT